MEALAQLEHSYFLAKAGMGDYHACIDWAVDRVCHDEEGDDEEIVLLAAASRRIEVLTLTEHVVERYCGHDALDNELAAGKYIAALRSNYLGRSETFASLGPKLRDLYVRLNYPDWLSVLCRNCEYAATVPEYKAPFEREFAYIAHLWVLARTRADFDNIYNRAISRQNDAF
jgi:hypothetical protein